MATLNYCDGCGYNFASTSAHTAHRIGDYGEALYSDKGRVIGQTPHTRRCLTPDEMQAKGWTVAVEPVRRRRENVRYVQQMETWHTPMNEKAKAYFAALKEKSVKSGEDDGDEEESDFNV